MFKYIFALCLFLLLPTLSQAQVIDGNGANSPINAKIEKSALDKATTRGDVDMFSGLYQQSVDLGSVSTLGGISYSFQLNYSSTLMAGNNMPLTLGIPYGEGWELNVPSISIPRTMVNHMIDQNGYSLKPLDTIMFWNDINCAKSLEEGRLYYSSPVISVNGLEQATLVYRDSSQGRYVFVPKSFSQYFEAYLYPGDGAGKYPYWVVKDNRGVEYVFPHLMYTYSNASNKTVTDDQGCMDDNEVQVNLYAPKTTMNKWYCSVIRDPFLQDSIQFTYKGYGAFNMVEDSWLKVQSLAGFTRPLLNPSYSEIFLQSVKTLRDSLVFEYGVLPYSATNKIPGLSDEGVSAADGLYLAKSVPFGFGQDQMGRYNHIKTFDPANIDSDNFDDHLGNTNPYAKVTPSITPFMRRDAVSFTGGGYSFAELVTVNGFTHQSRGGFLQSSAIAGSELIAGDLYRIGYNITGNTPAGPSYFDLRFSYGKSNQIPALPSGTNLQTITLPTFDKGSGHSFFSTSSAALKPTLVPNNTAAGAVYFSMPNLASSIFDHYRLEVGPGNSETRYSFDAGPDQIAPCVSFYHRGYQKPYPSANPFFGVGYPWYGVKAIDPISEDFCDLENNHNWWRSQDYQLDHDNMPLAFKEAKLTSLTLTRLTRQPMVLAAVTSYQRDTLNLFARVSQVRLTHSLHTINNLAAYSQYSGNATTNGITRAYATSGVRNVILLDGLQVAGMDNSVSLNYSFGYSEQVIPKDDVNYNPLFFMSINPFLLSSSISPLGKSKQIRYKPMLSSYSTTGSHYEESFSYNSNYDLVAQKSDVGYNGHTGYTTQIPERPMAMQLYFVVDTIRDDQDIYAYRFENLTAVVNDDGPTAPHYAWAGPRNQRTGFERAFRYGPLHGNSNYSKLSFSVASGALFGKMLQKDEYDVNGNLVLSDVSNYQTTLAMSRAGGSGPHPDFQKNGLFYDVPRYGPSRKSGFTITSHFVKLASSTMSSYETGGTLSTVRSYAYHEPSGSGTQFGKCLLASESIVNSDGNTQTTAYQYAAQLSDAVLSPKGIYSIPLETTVNSGQGGGSKIIYASFSGKILPSKTFSAGRRSAGEQGCQDGGLSDWALQKEFLSYNARGDLTGYRTGCDPNSISQNLYPNGWVKSSTYISRTDYLNYNQAGSPIYHYFPDGQMEKYTYDGLNRLLTISSRYGGTASPKRVIQYEYVVANGLGLNSIVEKKLYDGFQEQKTDTRIDSDGAVYRTTKKKATAGNGDLIDNQVKDAFGAARYVTRSLGADGTDSMTYEPSSRHRLLANDLASTDRLMSYEYNVNTASATPAGYSAGTLLMTLMRDEHYHPSRTFTDKLGRVVMSSRFQTGTPFWLDETRSYNARGQVTNIKNSANENYVYTYYVDGLLKSKSIPGGGTYTYQYDNRGRLRESLDPAGNRHAFTFTQYGEALRDSVNGVLAVSRTYGSSGIQVGKIIAEQKKVYGTGSMLENYSYRIDAYGRVDSVTWVDYYGSTESVRSTFLNHMDLVDEETRSHTSTTANHRFRRKYTYFDNGQLREVKLSIDGGTDKILAQYAYDGKLRYTSKLLGPSGGGNVLEAMSYQYHPRGWMTKINDIGLTGDSIPACQLKPEEKSLCEQLTQYVQGVNIVVQYNNTQVNSGSPPVFTIKHSYNAWTYGQTYGVTPPTAKSTTISKNGGSFGSGSYNTTTVISAPTTLITPPGRNPNINHFLLRLDTLLGLNQITQEAADFIRKNLQEVLDGDFPVDCKDSTFKAGRPAAHFAEELRYENAMSVSGGSATYNGNVGQVLYQVAGSRPMSYGLRYDMLDRLQQATFAEIRPDGIYTSIGRYNEFLAYGDGTGNITTIKRNGVTDTCSSGAYQFGPVDDLQLTYSQGKLTSVQDNIQSNLGFPNSAGSFQYDNMGRMTYDPVALKAYTYYPINRIDEVGAFKFAYDIDGVKRKVTKTDTDKKGNPVITTHSYISGIEYRNDTLEALQWEEGRIVKDPTVPGGWRYEYYLKDHLGSVRLLVCDTSRNDKIDSNELFSARFYYPFGMEARGPWDKKGTILAQDYTYTGQERLSLGVGLMDYDARLYYSGLGRFMQVDPLADQYASWNRYAYTLDNPIRFTDPTGMAPDDIILRGLSNSSVTLKTDLIDLDINVGSLGLNFNGQYTLQGEAVLSAGLDLVGILDPSGIADGLNAVLQSKSGQWGGAVISAFGLVPYVGDLAKAGKIGKDVRIIENAIDAVKSGDRAKDISKGTDYVVTPRGEAIKIPDGATGPTNPNKGSGMVYQNGAGGKGMSERTTGVRIMDANSNQGRRVNYMNKGGQTVDPISGKTISNKDPRGHLPLKN